MTVISVCHHNYLRYSLHRQRLCLTALHALSLHLETSKTQIKCSCKFFYEKLSKCSDTKRGWTGSKVQSPEPRFQSWILDPQFLKVSVSTYVVLFIIRKSMRSSFISGLFHFLNFLIFFIFFMKQNYFLRLCVRVLWTSLSHCGRERVFEQINLQKINLFVHTNQIVHTVMQIKSFKLRLIFCRIT